MTTDDVINETLVRPRSTVTSAREETPVFSASASRHTSEMRTSRSSEPTPPQESDVIMCPKCFMSFRADEHVALIDHVNECCE